MTQTPPQPEPDPGHIPLDLPESLRVRPQPAPAPDLSTSRPSLVPDSTDLDACPNCGKPMAADAVVCFNCGYDQKSARVVKPEVGVVVLEPQPPVRREKPEFVLPGRGSPRVVAIAGVACVLAAMIVSATVSKNATVGIAAALAGLVLVQTLLHTGTGVAGVWLASKFTATQFERHVDLAASRMLLAVGVFQLVAALRLSLESPFARAPVFLLAVGAYWLVLFAFFRRSHRDTSLLAACHMGVWMLVEFSVQIQTWLASAATLK